MCADRSTACTGLRRRADGAAESGPAAMRDDHDPDVESFLLLLAANRSPRTVDAYRRDLAAFGATVDSRVGDAKTEQIEAWLATMRADGRAPSTIARRLAAVRSYLRHQMLMGMRADNPASAIAGPRRPRTVPRALADRPDLPGAEAEGAQAVQPERRPLSLPPAAREGWARSRSCAACAAPHGSNAFAPGRCARRPDRGLS